MYDTIQKTIIAWAFNHYIAYYYFDNVNINQLKVAFERGEVELENLPIKQDALKHFNLPMDVVSGVVGRLSIKVPIRTLLTEPWSIKISNLMLIVMPKHKSAKPSSTKTSQQDHSDISNGKDKLSSEVNISEHNECEKNLHDEDSSNLVNGDKNLNGNKLIYGGDSISELLDQKINDRNDQIISNSLDKTTLDDNDSMIFNPEVDESDDIINNSEETKLAEFYSSFSATVSGMVKDIYRNIKLDIESMTILFEDFDHGLINLNIDHLALHRPKSERNLFIENLTFNLSNNGPPQFGGHDHLIRINVEKCNFDIFDEHSNNMQLVAFNHENDNEKVKGHNPSVTCSEIRCDGRLYNVTIDEVINHERKASSAFDQNNQWLQDHQNLFNTQTHSKPSVFVCDQIKSELKFSKTIDDKSSKPMEKNLQMKFDISGMQYIYSQRIHDVTINRLKKVLNFILDLNEKSNAKKSGVHNDPTSPVTTNKLLNVNVVDSLMYIVDEKPNKCPIPTLELSLNDFRILQFSGKNQQNGFVFAKVGCNHYNRESSSWDIVLHPWSFNLNWDFKKGQNKNNIRQKLIHFTSDELAEFRISNSFIDLCDVSLRKIVLNLLNQTNWPLAVDLNPKTKSYCQDINSIFVINNECGHKIFFAPLEKNSGLFEINEESESFIVSGSIDDSSDHTAVHKVSTCSRSSCSVSRDSPDLISDKWMIVEPGCSTAFQYGTLPIYRRYINENATHSRVLLVRVEGWKTLLPVFIDQIGTFYRQASSDRVFNEDTHIAISINLEESSARKIISIRSPLNLVNMLDATLEVHFVEAKQAFYVKPDNQLSVPLPYLYNTIKIRPCSVGVTISEESTSWDEIRSISDTTSRIFICRPISVTNTLHASYSKSQFYRVCVAIQKDLYQLESGSHSDQFGLYQNFAPLYSIKFMPPLTVVNLLPLHIDYTIDDVVGNIKKCESKRIYHVDTTKPNEMIISMDGFPRSKPISIDPGATGTFCETIEMLDERNRPLFLKAKIMSSCFEPDEPAIRIIIYAQYWFLNRTGIPLIFKQEGTALEGAGQFRDHEDKPKKILLFSFYDTELEPPWLCTMRLGANHGTSNWCEGFKLDKGNGERRINFLSKSRRNMKHLIDISIRKGYGKYSETVIATFNLRYGFDSSVKTPKKTLIESPNNYKLTSYNHNTNLADLLAGQGTNLFNTSFHKCPSDINLVLPGFKLSIVGKTDERLVEASLKKIELNCRTKSKEQIIDCSIQDIRIENSLPDCENSVMLDRSTDSRDQKVLSIEGPKPAIRLIIDRVLGSSFGASLFRQVQISTCELMINIEEKLFLKLVEFMSFSYTNSRQKRDHKTMAHDLESNLDSDEDRKYKYYFDLLRIDLSSLQLSVFTSPNISETLQKLKSYYGLKFFSFEDAKLELTPYFKMNMSRTIRGVFESVTRFYKRQILDQAPRIVGQQIQNYLRFHLTDLLSTLYDELYNRLMIL